ncbi:hypothetical protein HDU89_005610 [Geranomyces variabilis]|nr:hypothetical protein HDU89_005610 [Geranomyces variabilis]
MPSVSTANQPPLPSELTNAEADQPAAAAAAPTSLISAHIAHLASPNILISTRLPQIRWEKTAAHTLSQKLLLAHRVADAEKLLTQLAARQLALATERAQLDARIAAARDRRRGVEGVLRDLLVLHRDVQSAAAAAASAARERGSDVPASSSSLASLAGGSNVNAGLGTLLRPGGGGGAGGGSGGGGGGSYLSPRPPLPFAASVLALHALAPHRPAGPNAAPQHPAAQALRRASMGGGGLGASLHQQQQQHQRHSPLAVAVAASDDGESDQEEDKTHNNTVQIKIDVPPVLVVPPPPPPPPPSPLPPSAPTPAPPPALAIPTLIVPGIHTTAASDNDDDGPSAFVFVVEEAS